MLQPKKNSHKEFDNEKKFLRLENSPPPPPIIFLMVRPLVEFAHWLSPCNCHARSNSLNTANSLSSGPLNLVRWRKKIAKKRVTSDSLQIWPTESFKIDLAKYVFSSSSRGVLSFTQRFFKRRRHWGFICRGFCEEWKLVSTNFNQILQIQVKQIVLKDSGG